MKSIRFLIAIFAVSAISLQFIGDPPKIRTIGSGPYVATSSNLFIIQTLREEYIIGEEVTFLYEHQCTSAVIQNVTTTKNGLSYTNFDYSNQGGGKTKVVIKGLSQNEVVRVYLKFTTLNSDKLQVGLEPKMVQIPNVGSVQYKSMVSNKSYTITPCDIMGAEDSFKVTGQNVQTNPNSGGTQKN